MDTLSVIISSPAHTPHKFTLSVTRQCTILELKEIIATRLDSKPVITDQRLIYGGRILNDKDSLDRVFEKVDCSDISPTIHLVVSQRQHISSPGSSLRFRENTMSTAATPLASHNSSNSSVINATPSLTPFTSTAEVSTTMPWSQAEGGMVTHSTVTSVPTFSVFIDPLLPPAYGFSGFAGFVPSPAQQSMQHVIINGMPYLVPAAYLPILHHQHCIQQAQAYYGSSFMFNSEESSHTQSAQDQQAVAGQVEPNVNRQVNVARDHQRRAASLWLLMKLAFGVYIFSQNGSIERIVLLHIAALIIFLHQTGRLRIVRRIVHPPADVQQPPAAQPGAAPIPTTTATQAHQNTSTTSTTSLDNNNVLNNLQQAPNSTSGNEPHSNVGGNDTQAISSPSSATTVSNEVLEAQVQTVEVDQQRRAQQPPVSTWRSIEHGLLTFITSLVPAPPPEIDPAVANAAAAERGM
ncbi:hypothetical protein BX616_010243 [Lobosporangium transversale]|uniref:Ubiquitin-like domain-containing protein n=1 Tax=Lobosporangium transversale TaxID=64571 RepID=A0A1Y2GUD6_9FUNG|nr:hypothetical protein BCR41DRAFT_420799 [Lobosporangium transversale]KAF9918093.1 hypothetical protein BX616_010243 [Lobosporangium transversale]ORZ21886.1 hypothetical protein BCR41DRAFT_420799 [Lobosporangium transversale]|eukprot:XP_021883137.1 hypothetical protein BCR41DRAFT_420799 [Lobosporangium transversale]